MCLENWHEFIKYHARNIELTTNYTYNNHIKHNILKHKIMYSKVKRI